MLKSQPTGHELAIPLALVRLAPANAPIVSAYADWRVSERGLHEAPTVIEHHLRQSLAQLPVRGEAHASLAADAERILHYLADQADPAARGLVIFASHGRGLWFVQESVVQVATTAHVGDAPLLLPFAELVQDAGSGRIAVVDTEHLRLIDLSYAGVRELEGFDDDTWGATRISSRAAWRTANRQRAHETALERFAGEIAGEIAAGMTASASQALAIAGADEIVALVRDALPAAARDRLVLTGHVDMDTPEEEVVERIWPQMQAIAAAARLEDIQRLLRTATRAVGVEAVRTLIVNRRLATLALDPDRLPAAQTEPLLRQAIDQHSRVIIARSAPQLAPFYGVAGEARW
ncbi:MAG: hypothetical protein WC273_04385 [Dehalococcoidia bacterium]